HHHSATRRRHRDRDARRCRSRPQTRDLPAGRGDAAHSDRRGRRDRQPGGARGAMSTSELTAARATLRERQGSGARYDSPAAPARELEWARRGTAYFARVLSQTSDAELRRPSALPGWSKAALVAHVGYNARALTRLCEWARTGVRNPMYSSPKPGWRRSAAGRVCRPGRCGTWPTTPRFTSTSNGAISTPPPGTRPW